MDQLRTLLANVVRLTRGENATETVSQFSPSYADVCVARAMIKALKLPTELVLDILDRACYWPHQVYTMQGNGCKAVAGVGGQGASICLDVPVLKQSLIRGFGGERLRVKELEFVFSSHDQGWSSESTHGTYQTSSWLELSIMRRTESYAPDLPSRAPNANFRNSSQFHHHLQNVGLALVERPSLAEHYPQDGEDRFAWYIQGNLVAKAQPTSFKLVWSSFEDRFEGNEGTGKGEGFFDMLQEGDRILVWARAKWFGWECHVNELSMTLRYGF